MNDNYKNVFKLLLLAQHKFLLNFSYKLLRKNEKYQ